MRNLIIMCIISLFLIGCDSDNNPVSDNSSSNNIVGVWQGIERSGTGGLDVCVFRKDGSYSKGTIDSPNSQKGTYEISDNILTLTYNWSGTQYISIYKILINDNILSLKVKNNETGQYEENYRDYIKVKESIFTNSY